MLKWLRGIELKRQRRSDTDNHKVIGPPSLEEGRQCNRFFVIDQIIGNIMCNVTEKQS